MKDDNQLIYSLRQILGEEELTGFYLHVPIDDENEIKVPNFLFKDAPAQYPEIRLSKLHREKKIQQRFRNKNYSKKMNVYTTKFQVDIYSTNVVELNNICNALEQRIDLFNDIDMVYYQCIDGFNQINDTYIYKSDVYSLKTFNIHAIGVPNLQFKKIDKIENLIENSWSLQEDGLYICTKLPLRYITISSIINGLSFPDGTILQNRGIIDIFIKNVTDESALQNNEVERSIWELDVIYIKVKDRKHTPKLKNLEIIS